MEAAGLTAAPCRLVKPPRVAESPCALECRYLQTVALHDENGAPLVVAVVSRAAPHVKIPEWEQVLSSGAAAMNLVTAAHALGFAANWITEWYAYDRRVLDALGLGANEKIAGFVHIGRAAKPPEDRPRPPLSEIVSRFGA
jgi:nitroreductase